MANRFDLKFDNVEDLEGKVIIYSKFKNLHGQDISVKWFGSITKIRKGETYVFAKYVTTDAKDFAEKKGVTEEELEEAAQKFDSSNKAELKKDSNTSPVYYYGFRIQTSSDDDFSGSNVDVVFAGEHVYPLTCINSLEHAETLYFLKLQEQLQAKKDKLNKKKIYQNNTHNDYYGESIKEDIVTKYVLPLLKAYIAGDKTRVESLEKGFEEFSRASAFESDVKRLREIISTCSKDKINRYLIGMYIEKIDAIHKEEYEKAGEFLKEIKKLETE